MSHKSPYIVRVCPIGTPPGPYCPYPIGSVITTQTQDGEGEEDWYIVGYFQDADDRSLHHVAISKHHPYEHWAAAARDSGAICGHCLLAHQKANPQ